MLSLFPCRAPCGAFIRAEAPFALPLFPFPFARPPLLGPPQPLFGEQLPLGVPPRRPLPLERLVALALGRALPELVGRALAPCVALATRAAGGLRPPALHRARPRADVDFRGAVKQHGGLGIAARLSLCALLHQGAMVDAGALPCPLERQVGVPLPGAAPLP